MFYTKNGTTPWWLWCRLFLFSCFYIYISKIISRFRCPARQTGHFFKQYITLLIFCLIYFLIVLRCEMGDVFSRKNVCYINILLYFCGVLKFRKHRSASGDNHQFLCIVSPGVLLKLETIQIHTSIRSKRIDATFMIGSTYWGAAISYCRSQLLVEFPFAC